MTGPEDQTATIAKLLAEIARLKVVEEQNAAALTAMNAQVIALHTELADEKVFGEQLLQENARLEGELRELNANHVRVYRHAQMVKRVARLLMDEVKV